MKHKYNYFVVTNLQSGWVHSDGPFSTEEKLVSFINNKRFNNQTVISIESYPEKDFAFEEIKNRNLFQFSLKAPDTETEIKNKRHVDMMSLFLIQNWIFRIVCISIVLLALRQILWMQQEEVRMERLEKMAHFSK